MHIGWRGIIKQYFHRNAEKFSVGIEIAELGIHISVFDHRQTPSCWIKQHFIELDDWPKKLKHWIQQQGLQHCYCNVVLTNHHYHIFQVDRPSVPDEELAQALRWTIKDLLADKEEMVIDYFDHPAQTAGANKVSVVAMQKKQVIQLAKNIDQANMRLQMVSIEEMALCELLPNHAEAMIVLSQHAGQELYLNIIKSGTLYFTRKLKGYALLSSLDMEEMQQGILESLATEIQRSMDYFESQLHQVPVSKVGLMLDTDFQPELAEALHQLIFVHVDSVSPDVTGLPELHAKRAYFTSLGAAMMQAGQKAVEAIDEI